MLEHEGFVLLGVAIAGGEHAAVVRKRCPVPFFYLGIIPSGNRLLSSMAAVEMV